MNTQTTPADTVRDMIDAGQYREATRAALDAVEATMTIRKGSGKPCPFGDARMGNWRFTITSKAGRYSSDFWQSIAGTEAGEVPTAYDIAACLQWHCDYDNAVDFARDFGYTNGKEATRTYKACKRQAKALSRLFTPDQLETLSQIA